MVVLRESPWYQEAVQQGIEQGVQQGRRESLLRLLQLRFGEIPPEIEAVLKGLDLEALENLLAVALAANSLEEFSQQLPR